MELVPQVQDPTTGGELVVVVTGSGGGRLAQAWVKAIKEETNTIVTNNMMSECQDRRSPTAYIHKLEFDSCRMFIM